MRSLYAIAACLATTVLAVFSDEAYNIDYHLAYLGIPRSETTFFHQPFAGSKASLLYTFSEEGIFGAVNPKDGSIVWRQSVAPVPAVSGSQQYLLKAGENQDVVIAADGKQISAWSSSDGKSVWYKTYKEDVIDLEVLEMPQSDVKTGKDIVVLVGDEVQLLDAKAGMTKWTHKEEGGYSPYRISASATNIYLISSRSSSRGLTLRATTLDPVNGQKLDQHTLSSENDVYSKEDIVFVSSNSAAHILAWTDRQREVLKVNVLGTSHVSTFDTKQRGSSVQKITIHSSGRLDASPHFLAHYETVSAHWAEVYHIDIKTSAITKAYDLPKLDGRGAFSATTVDANVYFTRHLEDNMILVSSASHGVLGKWAITGANTPPLSSGERAYPVHATTEVVSRGGESYAVRSAVLLSNGNWILLRNGETSWTRLEALASAIEAVFVPLRTKPALAETLEAEAVQNPVSAYIHRLQRHIFDLQVLPSWLQGLPSFFGKSLLTLGSTSLDSIQDDVFGYNKLAVVATRSGRLIGIETGNRGSVAWNIRGTKALSTSGWSGASAKKALAYFEGADRPQSFGSLRDLTAVELEELEDHVQNAASATTSVRMHNDETAITYKVDTHSIKGYKGKELVWEFATKSGQSIIKIERQLEDEPIASIGKVLADRRVLYKYLNPNALLIFAGNEKRRELSAYLIDSVSGTALHSATHSNVQLSGSIASVLSENWFAYSFATDPKIEDASKGYQLICGELLESVIPDDRGILAAASNSSSIHPSALASQPYVMMQSYFTPYAVSSMAVTQTGQGITSRELLLNLLDSNAIVGVPRYLLDPRRVIGKAPSNKQMEEGLSQYSPVLDFDPKWYLNHQEELLGIKNIITTPSSLESTSLIFAYGHDIFGTRRTPSFPFDVLGNSFNKVTLILTVVALTIGTFVVAPFIERKQTNLMWQNS